MFFLTDKQKLLLLLKISSCLELFAKFYVAVYRFCLSSIFLSVAGKIYKTSYTFFFVLKKVKKQSDLSDLVRVHSPLWVSKTASKIKFAEFIGLFLVQKSQFALSVSFL